MKMAVNGSRSRILGLAERGLRGGRIGTRRKEGRVGRGGAGRRREVRTARARTLPARAIPETLVALKYGRHDWSFDAKLAKLRWKQLGNHGILTWPALVVFYCTQRANRPDSFRLCTVSPLASLTDGRFIKLHKWVSFALEARKLSVCFAHVSTSSHASKVTLNLLASRPASKQASKRRVSGPSIHVRSALPSGFAALRSFTSG